MRCLSHTAFRSSAVPGVGVYLVKFASMARTAAALMLSGVGKSGSPALKSTTSCPSRRKRSASAATFMVDDSLINEILWARSSVVGIYCEFAPVLYIPYECRDLLCYGGPIGVALQQSLMDH